LAKSFLFLYNWQNQDSLYVHCRATLFLLQKQLHLVFSLAHQDKRTKLYQYLYKNVRHLMKKECL
jgi:hypothetical protein